MIGEESYQEEFEENELFEHHRVVVDAGQSLMRIDKFLLEKLENTTRNKIQNAIKNGFVRVNEKAIKANYKVHPHDVILISFPEPPRNKEILPENIPLDIVFEDDDLLVINKDAGMVVHPAHGNWTGTLVNALVYHFNNLPTSQNGESRPGLIHRIDKDTSGLLVIAKSEKAMTGLAKQFYDHSIERTYYALVWGDVKEENGTITGHIGRSKKNRKIMDVYPEGDFGKHAITHYEIIRRYHYVTLVKCNLETGRTHQIRTHLKYIGHPLFNDAVYGGDRVLAGEVFTKYKQFVHNCFDSLPRQALHAKTLGFKHPVTQEKMEFDSTLPNDFETVLEKWKNYLNHQK